MSAPSGEPIEPSGDRPDSAERLLYGTAWKKAEIFFDWRHKVMTFSVSVVGAGIVAVGWLLNNGSNRAVVGLLLIFLAAVMVVVRRMDRRVSAHMADAYGVAAAIEQRVRGKYPYLASSTGVLLPFEGLARRRVRQTAPTRLARWIRSVTHEIRYLGRPTPLQEPQPDRGSLTYILGTAYSVAALLLALSGALIWSGAVNVASKPGPQKIQLVKHS